MTLIIDGADDYASNTDNRQNTGNRVSAGSGQNPSKSLS